MYRDKKTRKQTLSLKNFRRFALSSPQPPALQKPRYRFRSSSLLVGLTATVGITSIAFAATQQGFHPKSNQVNKASTSTSTPLHNQQSVNADINIQNAGSSNNTTQHDDVAPGATATNSSNAQVTINNESIPINNGTIQRTFTDSNGSTYSVTVNVDSDSTSESTNHSYTDINIHSSGSSSSDNMTRGSPRR